MSLNTTGAVLDLTMKSPFLAAGLALFSVMTIVGNVMVIMAVVLRPNLHSPTGYMILSLAGADLLVGLIIMPFNIVYEIVNHVWLFGLPFCDIWHSLDVLASTASIWNLCVIAVDRYLAVRDPLKYSKRMTNSRVVASLLCVWVGSSLIAFPAIAWWRASSPTLYEDEFACSFTDDLGFLAFSSLLSFYVPLAITLIAYWKIYAIALNYQTSLRTGHKCLSSTNSNLQMRIHRGGGMSNGVSSGVSNGASPTMKYHNLKKTNSESTILSSSGCGTPYISRTDLSKTNLNRTDLSRTNLSRGDLSRTNLSRGDLSRTNLSRGDLSRTNLSRTDLSRTNLSSRTNTVKPLIGPGRQLVSTTTTRRARPGLLHRLLAKESKAAKTLGVVLFCFIACWMPFFVVNILVGACASCIGEAKLQLTFTVVTWLGHCNSALNPCIYTFFNREFRHAFIWLLCYKRRRRRSGYNSYSTKSGIVKAIEQSLKVIVPQVSNNSVVVDCEQQVEVI